MPSAAAAEPVVVVPEPVVLNPTSTVNLPEDDNFESLPTLQRSFSLTYDDGTSGPQTDIVAAIESHVATAPSEVATEPAVAVEPPRRIAKRKAVEALEEEGPAEISDPNIAFSRSGLLFDGSWNSVEKPTDQHFLLREFNSPLQYQTLALRLSVPKNAGGWALNITPEEDLSLSDIYLHFNPRYKKGFIMLNDRQGTWGSPIKTQMDDGNHLRSTAIKASKMDLIVQVRREGFAVFINGVFTLFFMHRRDLFAHAASQSVGSRLHGSTGSSSSSSSGGAFSKAESSSSSSSINRLKLVIPAKDGNGNAEEITLHQVSDDQCE